MRGYSRLKKILTWTNMFTTVIALAVATPAWSTEHADFGFKKTKTKAEVETINKSLKRQLGCLARNVFYEANGEPIEGQMAVAQVTVNRARSGLFPRDLCAVVAQTTMVNEDTRVCQFAWYCDADLNKQKVISQNAASYIAAKRVLIDGYQVANIDKDVMWFHENSVKVNPRWPHRVATKIGNHVFYKRQK